MRHPSTALIVALVALAGLAGATVIGIGLTVPEAQQDATRLQVLAIFGLAVPAIITAMKSSQASDRAAEAATAVGEVRDAVANGLVSEPLQKAITEAIRSELLSEGFGAAVASVVRTELAAQLAGTAEARMNTRQALGGG